MPDIFDSISEEPKDIFDQIQPVKKQDIFDHVKSVVKKVLPKVPLSPTGVLTSATTEAMNAINKTVDPHIEKFRSETLPNKLAPLATTRTATGKTIPGTSEQIKPFTEFTIPTTKEIGLGIAGGSLAKGFAEPIKDIFEKISPSYATKRTVERETSALGRIGKNAQIQPSFRSTEILSKVKDAVADKEAYLWKPAWRYPDGKIERTGLKGHEMFSTKIPGRESGFVDEHGKFLTIADLGEKVKNGESVGARMSSAETIPKFRREIIRQEMDEFTKRTVGDVSVPKELEHSGPVIQAASKPSFSRALAEQILPEETALRKQGPIGHRIADNILGYSRDSQVMAGKAQEKVLPDLLKIPEEIRNQIPDYIEPRYGKERPVLAGEAKRTADKVRNYLKVWGKFLENQDIEVIRDGKPSKFYAKDQFFPRTLDTDALISNPELQNDELMHLLSSGQVKDVQEGKQVLEAALATKSNVFSPEDFTNMFGSRKVSTIERPRIYQFKNVTNDPIENLSGYFNNVSRRVNEIKYFGQHSEHLHTDLAKMATNGGNAKFAQEITNRILRQQIQDPSSTYLVRQLRAYQGITKLGLSAIPNIQQGTVNSYIRSGSASAVKNGFMKSFTKDGLSFARKAGVVNNTEVEKYTEMFSGITDKTDASTLEKLTSEFLKKTGFKKSEELNRIQAANIGKAYIEELAESYLKKPKSLFKEELENYGVNITNLTKRGKVSENELLKGANTFVGETQFGNRPLGQPHAFTSSPIGQIMGQFSSFPIQQGRLTLSAMEKRPLSTPARIAATAVGVGGPLGAVGNVLRGRAPIEDKNNPRLTMANYVLQSILNSGALGKPGNIATSGKYGVMGIAQQFIGPTISEVAKLGANIHQATQGKPKPLMKQGLEQVPIIGRGLSNVLLPSKKNK